MLNSADGGSPFWRLEWLDPAFSMCEQHPGKLETTWYWNLYYLGNFNQLLRRAHETPHRDMVAQEKIQSHEFWAKKCNGRKNDERQSH